VHALRAKLARTIDLEEGIGAGTPLRDALDLITKKSGLSFWIDTQSFKVDNQIDSIEDQTVALPKSPAISAESALSLLLSQVYGGFRIRDGYIEITTLRRLGIWDSTNPDPVPFPRIRLSMEGEPLEDALTNLAESSGANIVLDRRHIGNKARRRVTATLQDVQADTAVNILADLAGLKTVLDGNVLYVTSARKARAIEAEEDKRQKLQLQQSMASYAQAMGLAGPTQSPLGPIIVRSGD
jgi:hypothetical protein